MQKCTKFDYLLLKGRRRKWREGEGWRVQEKNEGPTTTKGKEGSG